MKQQAFSQAEVSSFSQQLDEVDEAYQRMLERENYVVELINTLSDISTSFENWEENLEYLLNNYDNIILLDDINKEYINIYIETYQYLLLTKDFPDEKSNMMRITTDPNYSIDAAVNYAYDNCYKFNSNYPNWTSLGGDCANFVSQCLYAGGKSMKGTPGSSNATNWSNSFSYGTALDTSKVSATWRGANAFKSYWQTNSLSYKKFSSCTSEALSYGYRGDAVSFLNTNGAAYHTLIIVSYGNQDLLLAQHTPSNDRRSLKNSSPAGGFIIFNMRFSN